METKAIRTKATGCPSVRSPTSARPSAASKPGEGALNHRANTVRDEGSAMAAGNGLDGDAERLADLGQRLAPMAGIAQSCSVEAAAGELMQHWDDALAVPPGGVAKAHACLLPRRRLPAGSRD